MLASLPAWAVRLSRKEGGVDDLARLLRTADISVIPHVSDEAVVLNMRTVFPTEVDDLIAAVSSCGNDGG